MAEKTGDLLHLLGQERPGFSAERDTRVFGLAKQLRQQHSRGIAWQKAYVCEANAPEPAIERHSRASEDSGSLPG